MGLLFPCPTDSANAAGDTGADCIANGNPDSPVATASPTPATAPSISTNTAPRRVIHVKTPFYQAKLDSQGAEAISWIITKNKDSGSEIYSVAGNKKNPVSLELVSQEGLKRQPREAPFQLPTGDAAIDQLLATSNYEVEGIEPASGDSEVSLAAGEKKRISFRLNESTTGLEVVKTLTYRCVWL